MKTTSNLVVTKAGSITHGEFQVHRKSQLCILIWNSLLAAQGQRCLFIMIGKLLSHYHIAGCDVMMVGCVLPSFTPHTIAYMWKPADDWYYSGYKPNTNENQNTSHAENPGSWLWDLHFSVGSLIRDDCNSYNWSCCSCFCSIPPINYSKTLCVLWWPTPEGWDLTWKTSVKTEI